MNLSYFISQRIAHGNSESFSSTVHKIGVVTISLGLAGALLSSLILAGFQKTVKGKIFNFSGDIIITPLTMSHSIDESTMNFNIDIYNRPDQFPFIEHIQEFAIKPCLAKTDDETIGFFFKGVGKRFNTKIIEQSIVEGKFFTLPDSGYGTEVLVSKRIASQLKAKVGDNLAIHFLQNPPRARRLKISGIYEINMSELFDNKFVLGDIRLVQRLNNSGDSIAGGLEVFLKNQDDAQINAEAISESIDYDLNVELVQEKYKQIFEWLDLLDRQVKILLGIIFTVVSINMISIILILIMERMQMVGTLKALGATNRMVRAIFFYSGLRLTLKGLVFGNVSGLGICFIQYQYKLIRLNSQDYYMEFVPVHWQWDTIVSLNILTLLIVSTVLLAGTMAVLSMDPIKSIKFD